MASIILKPKVTRIRKSISSKNEASTDLQSTEKHRIQVPKMYRLFSDSEIKTSSSKYTSQNNIQSVSVERISRRKSQPNLEQLSYNEWLIKSSQMDKQNQNGSSPLRRLTAKIHPLNSQDSSRQLLVNHRNPSEQNKSSSPVINLMLLQSFTSSSPTTHFNEKQDEHLIKTTELRQALPHKQSTTATTTTHTTHTTTTTSSTTTSTTTESTTSTTTSTTTESTTSTTTSTTTDSTTTTTTESTTTTTTPSCTQTTTPSPYTSCPALRWNQTGQIVAGTGKSGSSAALLDKPACVVMDASGGFYVCEHHNDRISFWSQCATSGIAVAGLDAGGDATALPHPEYLAIDKYGNMYVTGHNIVGVMRIPANSTNGTTYVAGGKSGSGLNQLDTARHMILDDDLNLYIVDSANQRVMKWAPNATTGVAVISNLNSKDVVGMVFAPNSSDSVYLSDEKNNCIYLWKFGASNPNQTLTQVNSTPTTLKAPQGIILDSYNNLYVADNGNDRVVVFCANSTIGITAVGGSGTLPLPTSVMDVALDADMNIYVALDGNMVVKYTRI